MHIVSSWHFQWFSAHVHVVHTEGSSSEESDGQSIIQELLLPSHTLKSYRDNETPEHLVKGGRYTMIIGKNY